ncbi:hypothetical protein DFS33DRAFT_1253231 [Desarmillaria ectypa]|nr:hypothetical protein DFS33DRAFT_1253231 [Desarmillaria ectypa]
MDTEVQQSPITTADTPFNDPTDNVDLIIRTADNVDFFVLSVLLSLQSPSSFFRQVLQGHKHTVERDGLPVLEVNEDSETFQTILLFCYPCVAPEIESVEQFLAVALALDKYCMDLAMEKFVQAVLVSPMISEQPLRVFALAVANGWKDLGEAAARNTLAMPLSQVVSDVEELNIITARHLYRLQDYHARCGKAAQIKVGEGVQHPWLSGKTSGIMFLQHDTRTCQWCTRLLDDVALKEYTYLYSHSWLTDTYLRLVNAKVLSEPRPQFDVTGGRLSKMTQAIAYKGLREMRPIVERSGARKNNQRKGHVETNARVPMEGHTGNPPAITTTDALFHDLADGVDLVIRTTDNVDFFVLSVLLSLRSPSSFFRQVLQGSKHTEERDGLPVLKVMEDSDTFRTILLFCYPYITPKIESVEQFLAVRLALDKYCMNLAMEKFVQAVLASSMISEQPLRVFALAVANGWKEIGEAAARNTLAMPLSQAISDVDELNIITARHLYCLQDYHTRCGKAAQIQAGTRGEYPWLSGKTSDLTFLRCETNNCRWCSVGKFGLIGKVGGARFFSHPWLNDTYFPMVNKKVLSEPRPQVALDDHIIDQAILASTKQCGRDHWAEIAGSQIRLLGKILAKEIDRRISEVGNTYQLRNSHLTPSFRFP